MPMRFARALVLAVIGGFALNIGWTALWRFLWLPYWQRRFENGQRPPRNAFRILFFAMSPAFVVFILLNGFNPRVWHFPLSEAMVGFVGAGLGVCWVLWRREDESGDRVRHEDVAQNS